MLFSLGMRGIALLFAAAALVVACGGSTADIGAADDGGNGGDGASGSDGGCGPPPPLHCSDGCGGELSAMCIGGQWVCGAGFGIPCPVDASVHDAAKDGGHPKDGGVDVDANAPFACGSMTCDPATQYCFVGHGGAVLPDGGTNTWYSCNALPQSCGAAPSCACVGNQGCPCTQKGEEITVECFYP